MRYSDPVRFSIEFQDETGCIGEVEVSNEIVCEIDSFITGAWHDDEKTATKKTELGLKAARKFYGRERMNAFGAMFMGLVGSAEEPLIDDLTNALEHAKGMQKPPVIVQALERVISQQRAKLGRASGTLTWYRDEKTDKKSKAHVEDEEPIPPAMVAASKATARAASREPREPEEREEIVGQRRYMLEIGVAKEHEPQVVELIGEDVETYVTYDGPDEDGGTYPVWCMLTKKEAQSAIRKVRQARIPYTYYKLNVGRLDSNIDVVDLKLVKLVESKA